MMKYSIINSFKLSIVALVLCVSQTMTAQVDTDTKGKVVVVHFNDGSKVSGVLKSWDVGKEVVIDSDGIEMTIPERRVKKVVEDFSKFKKEVPTEFQGEGLYYKTQVQLISGNDGGRAHHRVGYGITGAVGYQFSQYIGVGIGAGYREMIWDSGETMIPIYMEMHGYISNGRTRPFYNVELGYAFATENENFNILDATGGMSIYPTVGLEFGLNEMKYTLDLGYLFQNAEYTYGSQFGDGSTRLQTLRYQRLSLRFGVQF